MYNGDLHTYTRRELTLKEYWKPFGRERDSHHNEHEQVAFEQHETKLIEKKIFKGDVEKEC